VENARIVNEKTSSYRKTQSDRASASAVSFMDQ